MSNDKKFPAGHFHAHNTAVIAKLKSIGDLKQAVKAYVMQVVDDGIALHHAGASEAQIADSRAALLAKFDEAWEAMSHGTSHADVKK